jgi:hypothetical protein
MDEALRGRNREGAAILDSDALNLFVHWEDLAEWVLSPNGFYRLVTRPYWDAYWEHAEEFVQCLEELLESPDVPAEAKGRLATHLERVRETLEHKQTLEALDET